MKNLINNYLNKLNPNDLIKFGRKNDIFLSYDESVFLIELVKNNFNDIILNEDKYLKILENKFDNDRYLKIKNLFLEYKNKYQGYLF